MLLVETRGPAIDTIPVLLFCNGIILDHPLALGERPHPRISFLSSVDDSPTLPLARFSIGRCLLSFFSAAASVSFLSGSGAATALSGAAGGDLRLSGLLFVDLLREELDITIWPAVRNEAERETKTI
jgi:hypothetical protein